jgi:eukaryotic-like serine/threonine-protein kinase
VFNLSSWAQRRLPLADWLIDELHHSYEVPRRIARGWVEGGDVLPLLDGLDEVPERSRGACIESINQFLGKRCVNLVVCSRIEEYQSLATHLRLEGAIVLQALTRQQVCDYLKYLKMVRLDEVRAALEADAALRGRWILR